MIVLPSTSAGFQSSSLVGVNSITINSPNTLAFFTLKANTVLTIGNIFGANPAWADPNTFSDVVNFYGDSSFSSALFFAIYMDLGSGPYWDAGDFATDVTNTVIDSSYIYIVAQASIFPATIPLLNGNLAINKMFA